MVFAYTIKDQKGIYFVTFTVHQWVDVFTRRNYADIAVNSLQFCQREKGLMIYGWVIMSNHIHLIVQSNQSPLSDIIRDFKKYTATQIVKAIERAERSGYCGYLIKKVKFGFGKKAIMQKRYFLKNFLIPS